MKILFIHQNFPGQFKHLAPALAAAGHECTALTLRVKEPVLWNGVRVVPYAVKRRSGQGVHPWLVDAETKVIRGEACYGAARALREKGYVPDIIVGHPGWGETDVPARCLAAGADRALLRALSPVGPGSSGL